MMYNLFLLIIIGLIDLEDGLILLEVLNYMIFIEIEMLLFLFFKL